MDSDTSINHSRKHKSQSNRDHRLHMDRKNNYPNGYVEEWASRSKTSSINENGRHNDSKSISENSTSSTEIKPVTANSKMVSIILSTQNSILLNEEKSYDIRFSTGVLEGSGITINEAGNVIGFDNEGSYRFEICGEAAVFSDVDVKLIYSSEDFAEDIKPFSEITIPKEEGKLILRGIPTILPLHKGQKIIPRLIPTPKESIIVHAGTRLLIHRVA